MSAHFFPAVVPAAIGGPVTIAPAWQGFQAIAFSGSRSAGPAVLSVVRQLARAVSSYGVPVFAGDAAGVDAAAAQGVSRSHGGDLRRYVAASRAPWALARRSAQMVRELSHVPSAALVAAPCRPCPAGLSPSARSRECFAGFGSGTWASVALAAGLGLRVFVLHAGAPSGLPAWPRGWHPVRLGEFPAWALSPMPSLWG